MRKIAHAIVSALGLAGLAWLLWVVASVCRSPTTADATTHHTVAHQCHGQEVFITPVQDATLQWSWIVLLPLSLAIYWLRRRQD